MKTQLETPTEIEGRVHRLFVEALELDVGLHTDMIGTGVLDSLVFVQLLVALEQEFDVKVDVAELDLENFTSVARIARFVEGSRRRNGSR